MALAIALLAVSVFTFSAPASADDTIIYNLYEAHSEIYIDLLDGDSTTSRTVQFTVPYDGWYIIQTMGFPTSNDGDNGRTGTVSLKNSSGQSVLTSGTRKVGYGLGKLVHCELASGALYTLTIRFSDAVGARIVITHAEGLFDQTAPIDNYNDITSFEPDVIEFEYTESNHRYAQVALVECSETDSGTFTVDVDGSPFNYVMLLDPRVLDDTGDSWLYSGSTVTLDANVPYYLVVYFEPGYSPVDFPCVVTITFRPV